MESHDVMWCHVTLRWSAQSHDVMWHSHDFSCAGEGEGECDTLPSSQVHVPGHPQHPRCEGELREPADTLPLQREQQVVLLTGEHTMAVKPQPHHQGTIYHVCTYILHTHSEGVSNCMYVHYGMYILHVMSLSFEAMDTIFHLLLFSPLIPSPSPSSFYFSLFPFFLSPSVTSFSSLLSLLSPLPSPSLSSLSLHLHFFTLSLFPHSLSLLLSLSPLPSPSPSSLSLHLHFFTLSLFPLFLSLLLSLLFPLPLLPTSSPPPSSSHPLPLSSFSCLSLLSSLPHSPLLSPLRLPSFSSPSSSHSLLLPGCSDDCSLHEAATRQCAGSLQWRLGPHLSAHQFGPNHHGPILQDLTRIHGKWRAGQDDVFALRMYTYVSSTTT